MTTSGATWTASKNVNGLAALAPGVAAALSELDARGFPARLSARDHTLWRPDPTEIANRLGWLEVAWVRSRLRGIRALDQELRREGVRDVVLLGMGGSSLAPEVFFRTFGAAPGHPTLHVLDTTSPAWIRRVAEALDPRRVHFLVASKSGSTIEVSSLFEFFFERVSRAGVPEPGACFTAITDPGTALEKLSAERGFRAIFRNRDDIGGRYSALSFFGLVPAGLLGIPLEDFLARAEKEARASSPEVATAENPGAILGAVFGAAHREGRDKLTLLTSPRIESFALWVEQLLAESTGKEGRGIVPVAGEPWAGGKAYGRDRLFVALRLEGDDNVSLDEKLLALGEAKEPVWMSKLESVLDLSAEMFRWEYATAACSHLIGIHPFDQPNVQSAKLRTGEILSALEQGKETPSADPGDPASLLRAAREGDYAALMCYGDPNRESLDAISELRRRVLEKRAVATTFGLGPRFLHSTGQLHKGGGAGVIALQIVLEEGRLEIPGRAFDFGELMRAQADGDLRALREAGLRAARIDTGKGAARALRDLARQL
jgi:glucose-6-phosphate isomerase/transaldolase/glucose-6-phosphate isomerase